MYLSILFFFLPPAKVRIICEIKEYRQDEKIKIPRYGDRIMLGITKKREVKACFPLLPPIFFYFLF